MSMRQQIETKLTQAFAPEQIEVIDDSEAHRGHGGWREGGETHFHVRMIAGAFAGQTRVARQRAVHKCLSEELASTVHALGLELSAPGE